MKKLVFIAIITATTFSGCVKQKNCDCDITGKFIYFEEQEEIIYCGYEHKVNAAVIPGSTEEESSYSYYDRYNIVGSIPKEFRTNDTVSVRVCLDKKRRKGLCLTYGVPSVYKLTCIEKED